MKCSCPASCAKKCTSSLCVGSLGLSLGVVWALGVLLIGLIAWKFNYYGDGFIKVLSSIYIGYAPTPKGIAIGTGWALLDGLVSGILIAWLYNFFHKVCLCCSCCLKCKQDHSVYSDKTDEK